MLLLHMFSRRWILTTILSIAAVAVMVRLGIWQLDRLEGRRDFNARVTAQLDQPPLELAADSLDLDLFNMEYRQVVVSGRYDPSQEVVVRNQVWEGRLGVHVLTPLLIEGSERAVLVDRGWIPQEDARPDERVQYAETGSATVRGVIRRPQSEPEFGGVPDPTLLPNQERLDAWNFVNLERIDRQVDARLLLVYVQQSPDPNWMGPPYRSEPELELSEGPHLGYAVQWFTFAAILAVGYPVYVRRAAAQGAQGEGAQSGGNKRPAESL